MKNRLHRYNINNLGVDMDTNMLYINCVSV